MIEEDLIIEMWDVFKEYIPEKNKDVAAAQYVDYLLGKDVEASVLEGMMGYDSHLDDAIKTAVLDENFEDEDEDDSYAEDEDY